ncbi:hypothetical protein HELRODRAFT_187849 [Helobdella robusta]|uniref:Uncharacterized protein n=1 Tax=Helobdella robusta TaxID=6412 RepID=T1FPF3_HELRO|nr:hypothetical protein HELRODRAFT_187849 [Helobdella robusta]ESO12364.1 hypothetical protein HELRODRAFT_187849 [Helobdella robusta]
MADKKNFGKLTSNSKDGEASNEATLMISLDVKKHRRYSSSESDMSESIVSCYELGLADRLESSNDENDIDEETMFGVNDVESLTGAPEDELADFFMQELSSHDDTNADGHNIVSSFLRASDDEGSDGGRGDGFKNLLKAENTTCELGTEADNDKNVNNNARAREMPVSSEKACSSYDENDVKLVKNQSHDVTQKQSQLRLNANVETEEVLDRLQQQIENINCLASSHKPSEASNSQTSGSYKKTNTWLSNKHKQNQDYDFTCKSSKTGSSSALMKLVQYPMDALNDSNNSLYKLLSVKKCTGKGARDVDSYKIDKATLLNRNLPAKQNSLHVDLSDALLLDMTASAGTSVRPSFTNVPCQTLKSACSSSCLPTHSSFPHQRSKAESQIDTNYRYANDLNNYDNSAIITPHTSNENNAENCNNPNKNVAPDVYSENSE